MIFQQLRDHAMRRFRFHLGTLVILVLLLGVGFAALRESNEIWDSSIFIITLGLLLISILLAIYRTDKRRAFWLGFAVFGSAYLALWRLRRGRRSWSPRLQNLGYGFRGRVKSPNGWRCASPWVGLAGLAWLQTSADLTFSPSRQSGQVVGTGLDVAGRGPVG